MNVKPILKRLFVSFGVATVVCLYLLLLTQPDRLETVFSRISSTQRLPGATKSPPQHSHRPSHGRAGEWVFDSGRDAQNIALTSAQCSTAFPDLYADIDRAVTLWRDELKHEITPRDIEISWRQDAAFRVLIHDNQLRILKTKHTVEGYNERSQAVLHQLYRALLGAIAARETLPDVEVSIVVDDMSLIPSDHNNTHTIWAFARRIAESAEQRVWLMPDFNFWALEPMAGGFQDMRWRAKEQDAHIVDKIPKAVWRGTKWTNEFVRGSLLTVTEGQDWADVKVANKKNEEFLMPMDALCRYMFPVHTEGRSWSGRLKFLLNCNSVSVVHDLDWQAHYYHLLVPEGPRQNYVPVKKDFSDLGEKVKWYLERPEEAQKVASNAVQTFRERYTTVAAETCYWRRLIQSWSEVAFEPELYEKKTIHVDGENIEIRQLRGTTFEEFM